MNDVQMRVARKECVCNFYKAYEYFTNSDEFINQIDIIIYLLDFDELKLKGAYCYRFYDNIGQNVIF